MGATRALSRACKPLPRVQARPGDHSTLGNAVWLLDSSPGSRYLLLEAFLFQYASDAGGSDPVLHDAQSGTSSDPLLMYQAFTKWAKRDCVTSIRRKRPANPSFPHEAHG
jgi:hypothetical protein